MLSRALLRSCNYGQVQIRNNILTLESKESARIPSLCHVFSKFNSNRDTGDLGKYFRGQWLFTPSCSFPHKFYQRFQWRICQRIKIDLPLPCASHKRASIWIIATPRRSKTTSDLEGFVLLVSSSPLTPILFPLSLVQGTLTSEGRKQMEISLSELTIPWSFSVYVISGCGSLCFFSHLLQKEGSLMMAE